MGSTWELIGIALAFVLLVAWALHDVLGLPFAPVFALLLLALVAAGYTVARLIGRTRWHEEFRELERTIVRTRGDVALLDSEEAVRLAETALADPGKFETREDARADTPALRALPPLLRRFFGRYRTVASLIDGTELDRAAIRPSEIVPGFTVIGSAGEHTELAIGAGDDEICILAGDVPPAEAIESEYASIYHYFVFVDRLHASGSPERDQ